MVQQMLADSAIEIETARLLVLRAAHEIDQGRTARERISMVKVDAAETLGTGRRPRGAGLRRHGLLPRTCRSSGSIATRAIFRIYDGTSEIHRTVVARGAAEARRALFESFGSARSRTDMPTTSSSAADDAVALIRRRRHRRPGRRRRRADRGVLPVRRGREALSRDAVIRATSRWCTRSASATARRRGMNCFAHEGMVKRVIGGHWVWSPRMQELARDEKIEAYVLPGGVHHAAAIARSAPGGPACSPTSGLGTFVDPRHRRRQAERARHARTSSRWSRSTAGSGCATSRSRSTSR